jgi:hypothetical protein
MRCPDIWLNIILGVSVSVFLEDRALSTAYFLPQYRWTLANTLRAQENKKVEKVEFSFSASLPDLSSVLCPWTRNYIIFLLLLRTEPGIYAPSFLQRADHGS